MQSIFERIGQKYGFEEVKAEFSAFRDFKVKWVRSYKWIQFDVSDYLKGAPEEVMEGVADTLFAKIRGENASYPDVVCNWLTSPEFVQKNQKKYLGRCWGLDGYERLAEAFERLVNAGLVEDDGLVHIEWMNCPRTSVGHSSVLMKVATLNTALKDQPDDVLDFALYTQLAHVNMGFNGSGVSREGVYKNLIDKYPDAKKYAEILKGLGYTF